VLTKAYPIGWVDIGTGSKVWAILKDTDEKLILVLLLEF
jgi:hypothetical protein